MKKAGVIISIILTLFIVRGVFAVEVLQDNFIINRLTRLIRLSTYFSQMLIGSTATSTDYTLEVHDDIWASDTMRANEFCINTTSPSCITAWPTSGSGSYPINQWLDTTNTPTFVGLNASSTNVDSLTVYDGITLGGVYRNTWPAASGSSAGSWWATSSNGLIGYPDLTGDYSIVVGAAATTSNVKFEVNGSAKIGTDLTIGTELLSPAARLTVLNATTTNIDNLTVYSSVSLPNNSITDLMVADNITASNYLSLANWFSTTTHANIASLPSLSITESQISDLSHYTNADTGDYLDASTTIQTYFSNAATAFSWGNHATAGYLSSSLAATTYLAVSDWYSTTTWAGGNSLSVATTLSVATSTPWSGYELAVNGDGVFSGNLYVLGNATSSHLAAQEICLNGSCRTSWPEGGSGSSLWTASGNNIYYNSGNVGIATTSPIYALDVWGTMRVASSSANSYLDFLSQNYSVTLTANTSSATTSPGTMAQDTSGVIWSNVDNAKASDNAYATVNLDYYEVSRTLLADNFGFNIPTGATILGIGVSIEMKNNSAYWVTNKLLKDGSAVGDNKSLDDGLPASESVVYFGGETDLWGTTWTVADINDEDFGIALKFKEDYDSSASVSIDHITIKVYYSYEYEEPRTLTTSMGIDKYSEIFKLSTSTGLTGKTIFSYNAAGNVGIRNDNASSTLHVSGDARFTTEDGLHGMRVIPGSTTTTLDFF